MKSLQCYYYIVLCSISCVFTSPALSQIQRPGGVDENLNIWINSKSVNLVMVPTSSGSRQEYVYDWKFRNDASKTYISPFLNQAPLFYWDDTSRYLNQHESVSFFSDSVNRSMISTSIAVRKDTCRSLYFFCVPSIDSLQHAGRNPLFSTPFLPSSSNHFEVDIASSGSLIGWNHGLNVDTFYAPLPPVELNKPYLWTFKLEVDSLRENIAKNGRVIAQKANPNEVLLYSNLYSYLGYSMTNTLPANFGNFNLGELAFYQGYLSPTQIQKIESYMAFKFGIMLEDASGKARSLLSSNDSQFMWNADSALSYTHHLAGIGIDLSSDLILKQNQHAYSADKGDMLRMGIDTITKTNTSNPANWGSSDLVFYTWSDNNDSVSVLEFDDIPKEIFDSACVSRMPREWMMQRSQSDNSSTRRTYLSFDLNNTIDLSYKSLHSFRLLIDEDGNGDFTDGDYRLVFPTSFQDNILIFDSVYWDLDDNGKDVFTLLYDINIIKPKLYTRDTVYAIQGDTISIYEGLDQMDTLANYYNFYDANDSLIHNSENGDHLLTSSQIIKVGVANKNILCESTAAEIVYFFRPILKTFKKVIDADSSASIHPLEEIHYEIYVVNVDEITHSKIDGISIVDSIPKHTKYLDASVTAPGQYFSDHLKWSYTSAGLEYGDTLLILPSFTVVSDSDLTDVDYISNLATVTFEDPISCKTFTLHSGCDTSTSLTDCGTDGATIIPTTELFSDLSIQKNVVSDNEVLIGQQIEYRIEIRNSGPYTAHNVLVMDSLPKELMYISVSSSDTNIAYDNISHQVIWTLDSLEVDATSSIDVLCEITDGNSILNIANISSSNPDSIMADNRVEVFTAYSTNPINPETVPNIITPNGDGKNDVFSVPGLEHFPGSRLEIYDRWGSEVFHSDDYQNDWSGEQLLDGTYFIVLIVNNAPSNQIIKNYLQILH